MPFEAFPRRNPGHINPVELVAMTMNLYFCFKNQILSNSITMMCMKT